MCSPAKTGWMLKSCISVATDMYGQTDRQTDRQTDGQAESLSLQPLLTAVSLPFGPAHEPPPS